MRWENTSPCPMIIFFNLFLSSRHAVKIYLVLALRPHARAAYGHRISGKRRNCEDFSRRRIIEWNRNSKSKVLIEFNFSVCFVIQSAMSAGEKLFIFEKSYLFSEKERNWKQHGPFFSTWTRTFPSLFQNQRFAIHRQTWCLLPTPFSHSRTEQQSVITSLGHYNWPITCLS